MSDNDGCNCYNCIHAIRLVGDEEVWFRCTKFNTFLTETSNRFVNKPSSWCAAGTPRDAESDESVSPDPLDEHSE